MATLDVLDYAVALDEALAPRMHPAERKMAVREVRRIVDDMAFRFAFMSDRVLPDDVDYVRALEAVKSPEATADVLMERQPVYRRRRIRKNVTTAGVLAFLLIVGVTFWGFVASEQAEVLVDEWRTGSGDPIEESHRQAFTVSEETTRLQVSASVLVLRDDSAGPANTLTLTVLDPNGQIRILEEYPTGGGVQYLRDAIEQPTPGEWEIYVTYRDVAGSAEVTVLGVTPKS